MSDGVTRYRPQSAIQHLLFNHGLIIFTINQGRVDFSLLFTFSFLHEFRSLRFMRVLDPSTASFNLRGLCGPATDLRPSSA